MTAILMELCALRTKVLGLTVQTVHPCYSVRSHAFPKRITDPLILRDLQDTLARIETLEWVLSLAKDSP